MRWCGVICLLMYSALALVTAVPRNQALRRSAQIVSVVRVPVVKYGSVASHSLTAKLSRATLDCNAGDGKIDQSEFCELLKEM